MSPDEVVVCRGHDLPVETAQDAFKRMIREKVAPGLRALGFKRSGQRFVLPSESGWHVSAGDRALPQENDIEFPDGARAISLSARR